MYTEGMVGCCTDNKAKKDPKHLFSGQLVLVPSFEIFSLTNH